MYIDIKLIELSGFVSALQALRLPYGLESRSITWSRMLHPDAGATEVCLQTGFNIDDKDEDLLKSLIKRGDEHAKFIEDEKPRHFTAEKQLTVREIQERCGNSTLEWFNSTRVDDDNEKGD